MQLKYVHFFLGGWAVLPKKIRNYLRILPDFPPKYPQERSFLSSAGYASLPDPKLVCLCEKLKDKILSYQKNFYNIYNMNLFKLIYITKGKFKEPPIANRPPLPLFTTPHKMCTYKWWGSEHFTWNVPIATCLIAHSHLYSYCLCMI